MRDNARLQLQQQQLHERRSVSLSATARDPRVTPGSIHRNISIPETCAFYGVADAISNCRVPRSCADCLMTPGCYIDSGGMCQNVTTNYDNYGFANYDFRNATFANNSPVSNSSYNVFIAGTATYCAADDAVCATCRKDFEKIAWSEEFSYKLRTQFCKGANGCVCIGICEVPSVRTSRVYDWDCDQPNSYSRPLALPRPAAANRTKLHRDPRAPLVQRATSFLSRTKDETCAYMADVDLQGCRQPRTCQNCLQKPGCMISDFKCVDMKDNYSPLQDFRTRKLDERNSSYGGRLVQFPSPNTSYCAQSDAVCTACRARFQSRWLSSWDQFKYSGAEFCVGADDCVCIDACESEHWSVGVYDTECSPLRRENRTETLSPIGPIVLGVVAWIVLSSLYKHFTGRKAATSAQRQQPPPRQYRHTVDQAPSVVGMSLSGWRGYHDGLRAREQRVLRGDGDVAAADGEEQAETVHCGTTSRGTTSARDAPEDDSRYEEDMLSASASSSRLEQSMPQRGSAVDTSAAILRHILDQEPAPTRLDLFEWRQYQRLLRFKEMQLLTGVDYELVSPVRHPIDFDWAHPSAPEFDDDESSAPTAQDPRALASAPVFRQDPDEHEKLNDDDEDDARVATAPDFEFEFDFLGQLKY